MAENAAFRIVISKKLLLWGGIVLLAVGGLGGYGLWKINQPKSLLPRAITKQIDTFTPYFYFDQIPNGYGVEESTIHFEEGVLLIPLTKIGSPSVIISEQPMPDNLPTTIMENGRAVKGTIGKAAITVIEGHPAGVLIAPGQPKTFILLSGIGVQDAQFEALLQSLKAVD